MSCGVQLAWVFKLKWPFSLCLRIAVRRITVMLSVCELLRIENIGPLAMDSDVTSQRPPPHWRQSAATGPGSELAQTWSGSLAELQNLNMMMCTLVCKSSAKLEYDDVHIGVHVNVLLCTVQVMCCTLMYIAVALQRCTHWCHCVPKCTSVYYCMSWYIHRIYYMLFKLLFHMPEFAI